MNEFRHQMETLRARSCPEKIINQFEAMQSLSGKELVPVIPFTWLSPYRLLMMVRFEGNPGYALVYSDIVDAVERPQTPYFLRLDDTKFTAAEGVAVCIHTNILQKGKLLCDGSSHMERPLMIYLLNGTPVLGCG